MLDRMSLQDTLRGRGGSWYQEAVWVPLGHYVHSWATTYGNLGGVRLFRRRA